MQRAALLARQFLAQEAAGLLVRLGRLKPYSLSMPMVPAANVSPEALASVEALLHRARLKMHAAIRAFLARLHRSGDTQGELVEAQRRFALLRLHFNSVVTQFDIFSDVLSQRGEHETGVWVAGLDDVAADALRLSGDPFVRPPVVCYLDRGHGAAIRRARTRLPGGESNPVAVIRLPRERMIGSGIGSSLVHEVGHQGAALLDLVRSLRIGMASRLAPTSPSNRVWAYWHRWISEIIADVWSVARVGIGATVGLMAVVSLPSAFVYRIDVGDPHPSPWIRVALSSAFGEALYPHPQWERLRTSWQELYPLGGAPRPEGAILDELRRSMPALTRFVLDHRPAALGGSTLQEALTMPECEPEVLAHTFSAWLNDPRRMLTCRPCLCFAVIGQAKADRRITARQEGELLAKLLNHWALKSSLHHAQRTLAMAARSRPSRNRLEETTIS